MEPERNGQQRGSIRIGLTVDIIKKEDQRSGKKTRGIVQDILTNSLSHPHGIKVRLKGVRWEGWQLLLTLLFQITTGMGIEYIFLFTPAEIRRASLPVC
jgi:uncharacterized repeat protein (TIGR03833 family)